MSNQAPCVLEVVNNDAQCGLRLSNLLLSLNEVYQPHLSSIVSIDEYARKLCAGAVVVIARHGDENIDIGVVAFYANDYFKKTAFISTIGLMGEYQGSDVSDLMLNKTFSICNEKGFSDISLEVYLENSRAIKFYKKNGFKFSSMDSEERLGRIRMTKKL